MGGWAEKEEKEEEEQEEKEKEEKIPHMCESIGHRPLWGRCPKTGRPRAIPGGQKNRKKTCHLRIAHGRRYPMPFWQ